MISQLCWLSSAVLHHAYNNEMIMKVLSCHSPKIVTYLNNSSYEDPDSPNVIQSFQAALWTIAIIVHSNKHSSTLKLKILVKT